MNIRDYIPSMDTLVDKWWVELIEGLPRHRVKPRINLFTYCSSLGTNQASIYWRFRQLPLRKAVTSSVLLNKSKEENENRTIQRRLRSARAVINNSTNELSRDNWKSTLVGNVMCSRFTTVMKKTNECTCNYIRCLLTTPPCFGGFLQLSSGCTVLKSTIKTLCGESVQNLNL